MTETDKAVFKVHIRGSIEAVWREITKTDEPQLAIFGARLHTPGLQPGAPIRMRTADGKYTSVIGDVLEFDPPHRYSHTFRFTHVDEPECVVIYDLQEVDDGVDFTLTVDKMPVGTKTAKEMLRGGPFIVNTLKAVVEKGRPSLGTRIMFGVFKVLGPLMTPKKCLTKHWP